MKAIPSLFLTTISACCLLLAAGCSSNTTLFKQVDAEHSGIHFNNLIQENDSLNPIDVTNIYNGGGVGVGDFNNDGLQDIYFTGNRVANKLYLNKGAFKFEDITDKAGLGGDGRWSRGVSVVDINNDGWLDIYVCASMLKEAEMRRNLLYINQGVENGKTPQFKEMAAAYGLDDTTHSTMAAFFDYDNDGDLDMYLLVNEILKHDNPSVYRPKVMDGSHPSTGRLYRNEGNGNAAHPRFTNVSKEAGVTMEGYGHGVTIADFNKDGWKDIFVTNDFNSNDLLYINNADGTFTDKAESYFKHTSANGMGQDVIDINNDGLSDVIELDMNPEDNYRKKMMMGVNSYQMYQNFANYGYQFQYVRNTLQLNQGPRVNGNDSVGDPVFSDIAFYAGVAETDWSWTPLVSDFDNDGFRDIIVTNGFPRDITDHDFIAFRKESYSVASKEFTLSQIPQVKLHNYAYRNNGDLTFSNTSKDWGFTTPSFSNGAAYADLDNDGDMDVVVNNINDKALVYENTVRNTKGKEKNFIALKLVGDGLNRNGLGAWVQIYYDGKQQAYEQTPYRGYLSSIQLNPQFGIGSSTVVDSVVVLWPNGKKEVLQQVKANNIIEVNIKNAQAAYSWQQPLFAKGTWFKDITDSIGLTYVHPENDFIDFNIQRLLPHKFSEYGPAMAVGDVNGDGLDDVVLGGSATYSTTILIQQRNGKFLEKPLLPNADKTTKGWEDMGVLLFDADGDDDLDLYTASGGYENKAQSPLYADKLYINDGAGGFSVTDSALPQNVTSKSCVRAADFDKDGDLDLLVAGRVEPWKYPQPVSSFIYRNDSKPGAVLFTDITNSVAPDLTNIGLVADAIWTDFDGDGWQDIILAGEWMPLTFLKNGGGTFTNITSNSNLGGHVGWWTSIVPGDFDGDGDMDYIAGNMGLNSFYRASEKYPVRMYAKDFDNNGSYDAIPTLCLPTSHTDTTRREYPAQTRDDMTKQLISFKAKFQNYKQYATATFDNMMTPQELEGALVQKANFFSNSFIRNKGNGTFELAPLPTQAQFACLNGMLAEDFDSDGDLDLLVVGNDYGTEVSVGPYNACNGLVLQNDGKGKFSALSILQSGWYVPGNSKALVKLKSAGGKSLIMASQNKGPLKVFEVKTSMLNVPLQRDDVYALVKYKNGKIQKRELPYGASLLSQSGRHLMLGHNVAAVEVTDVKGAKRQLQL